MRIAAALQQYSDFEQQAVQLLGYEQAYQQLDRGPYSSTVLFGHGDEGGFNFNHTSRRLARKGLWPTGVVSAVVQLAHSGCAAANGLPFATDDVILVGSGGESETVTGPGFKSALFHVPLESAAAVPLRRLADLQAGKTRRVADPGLAGKFRDLAAVILRSWDEAAQTIAIPQTALQKLMFELLTSPGAADGSSHPSVQIYRAARDVMLDALMETLTVPEIASRVGTSRRTLDQAFDKCVSASPAQFHKLLRLNNARRLLIGGQHSVSRAAISSGLHHLGRFSNDYRALFGELPSEAARRARALNAAPD